MVVIMIIIIIKIRHISDQAPEFPTLNPEPFVLADNEKVDTGM